MGSAAAVLQSLQTVEWNASLYGVFSDIAGIAVSLKKKANVLHLAYSLHKCNKQMQTIFDEIHAVAEDKVPRQSAQPITESRARDGVHDLMRLYRTIEGLYESLSRAGLTNNSLTAGQLLKFRAHGEAILDLADWLETSLNTEEITAIFARAARETERGEIYDLEQVQ